MQQAATPPAPPQAPAGLQRPSPHTGPVTALQLADRIRSRCAPPAGLDTSDPIVAGNPLTAVTGIATTAIATFDSLRAAAAANANLVVTLESTFWSDNDNLDRLEGSAVFKAKRDFIREHNLVVLHRQDHCPTKGPAGIATGMAKELAWDAYVTDPADPTTFKLPATTLLGLAQQLATKLGDRTMRIVGDPKLPVTNVAAKWGNANQLPAIHLLLVGYTHEWEGVEYCQDQISAGQKKALILLGESKSLQGGMKYCAEWLKTFITEVPITHIPVIEPYWSPNHPIFEINTKT